MGLLSSTFRFDLDGRPWRAKLRTTSKGYRYSVWVDDMLRFDEKIEQTALEMLSPQTITVHFEGTAYRLIFAPISAFAYGLHVYINGDRVYSHKNREFVRLHRTEKLSHNVEKFVEWCDSPMAFVNRPFWKIISEALIIGGIIGFVTAAVSNALERYNVIDLGDITMWVAIILAVSVIWFLPMKYRLFK